MEWGGDRGDFFISQSVRRRLAIGSFFSCLCDLDAFEKYWSLEHLLLCLGLV